MIHLLGTNDQHGSRRPEPLEHQAAAPGNDPLHLVHGSRYLAREVHRTSALQ